MYGINTNRRTPGLVSVVIPTYNQVAFIAETILSVLNQTYKNFELLICDDCSTDGTQDIIIEFAKKDSRIIPILNSSNLGLSGNINQGFKQVKGEFFNLMGGDDIMLPTKIEKQVIFLQANPDYDVTLHWVEIFDSETNKVIRTIDKDILESPTDWFFKNRGIFKKSVKNSTFPPTAYLARSSYALNSSYDVRLPYKNEILFAIDNYMAKPNAKWHTIPEVLGRYRMHANNMHTSSAMKTKILEEHYLQYAITMCRYPELAKQIKANLLVFLYNDLVNNWIEPSEIKRYEERFKIEAGCFNYQWMRFVKFLKKAKQSVYDRIS